MNEGFFSVPECNWNDCGCYSDRTETGFLFLMQTTDLIEKT